MKKILIFLVITGSLSASVFAIKDLEVMEVNGKITNLRGNIPISIPVAPNNNDRKGYVGTILSNIFNGLGDIKTDFISAFRLVTDTATNNVLKWDGRKFQATNLWQIGGNVGIGTSTPTSKLDVNGNINSSSNTLTSGSPNIIFSETGVTGSGQYWRQVLDAKNLRFDISSNNTLTPYSTIMQLNANGNVGIGTASPSRRLHISDIANDTVAIRMQDNDANWFLSTTTKEGFGIFQNTTGSGGARMIIDTAGNIGIGTTTPSGALKLEVSGNIGATEYCDENGNNCFTAASIGTGTGTTTSSVILGTSKVTKGIAPSGVQCVPSIVKSSAGLLCEYDKYKGELQVTSAGATGICGYTCDMKNITTYTEYTVFKKSRYWGGAKWIGKDRNQRVSAAQAICNPGDRAIQKRTAFHSNGMNTGNTYTPFIAEFNAMSSTQLDTNGVVWKNITNGDNFSYQRSYNGSDRLWGNRHGSYAVAEVKCVKIN